jgi:RNA polymerase I-specific transcription initiation factor RRN7
MSRPRFFKGPICGKDNCRSRYYYKADGQTFCRNNHLREGDVDYEIDDDEGLASGFGTRRKRGLQEHERSDPSERLVRVFGKAGYVLYLQALQCILKAQLQFLEARLHLTGVESLGKDLWEALLEAGNVQAQLPQDKHEDDRQSSSGVSDDNVQSSASENEVKGEPERKPPSRMYKSTRYTMHSPGLMHTFSICYLTLNLMRVPITIKVMHEWLVSGDLLFLHSRNILPDALFVRLEGRHHERLLPQSIPSVHRLWKWTSHTAQFLSLTSDIRFAPLNAPPVVLHFVKELLMPCKSQLMRIYV